ncbi:uncharacterized protein LOC110826575 isoform X1 [Zootermopsis nevadensis]|uniref:uncharacterized protein LOC110826575 isoform X1 n=1 Tax=Zootermopsis nevadensis TaxID=136037 RepID=UPI000B8E4869|nr:uncharacterized protein LOC110826575 isoform X1 [Zootermopsis nevadensis]
MDIPCLTVPQLQLPPWYSPPRKIPYLEKRSTNNMSVAVGTGASQIVDMLARDVRNILNPSGGFQVRKQNGGEATVPPLPSSVVATHAEATEKSRQEVAESIATVHDGNEPQVLPAACAMDQPQPDPGQSNFPPDHCMDEAPELTSTEDHQSSAHGETTTVSSTQQAAAPVNTTEVVDVIAAGGCVTLESAVQKIGAGCVTGSRGDYRQSTLDITDRPTSDNRLLTSQAFALEKTVHSDQVQPVTNIEDDDAGMNFDVPRYPSPVAGENVAGLDHTSEGDQYQDDCHFTASSEDVCCVLSPQGDFLMTSPDETIALKSPPFVMSPGFQTANNDLFGGLSGQQSNTGFTFSFGATNTGSGAAERNKPNEGFQFSFDKKTPSRSLFQLF